MFNASGGRLTDGQRGYALLDMPSARGPGERPAAAGTGSGLHPAASRGPAAAANDRASPELWHRSELDWSWAIRLASTAGLVIEAVQHHHEPPNVEDVILVCHCDHRIVRPRVVMVLLCVW